MPLLLPPRLLLGLGLLLLLVSLEQRVGCDGLEGVVVGGRLLLRGRRRRRLLAAALLLGVGGRGGDSGRNLGGGRVERLVSVRGWKTNGKRRTVTQVGIMVQGSVTLW